MIKILTKNKKRQYLLLIIALCLASGFLLYLLIDLSNILNFTNYRTEENYVAGYSPGYGGVNVAFHLDYRRDDTFDSTIYFHTISSQDVEAIGITRVDYDIVRDGNLIFFDEFLFSEPVANLDNFFVVQDVSLHDNISCIGMIDAKFDVEGIVQNETFGFSLSIIVPVNPVEIRNSYLLGFIWAEFGVGAGFVFCVGFTYRIVRIWRIEASFPEEERKKDREFFEYIGNNLETRRKQG